MFFNNNIKNIQDSNQQQLKREFAKKITKSLNLLPLELLIEIALFLKAPSFDILNFMLAAKYFYSALNHSYLWQEFTKRKFKRLFDNKVFLKKSHESWKSLFGEYYCAEKMVVCGKTHIFIRERYMKEEGKDRVFGFGDTGFKNDGCLKSNKIAGLPIGSKILDIYCGDKCTFFKVKCKNGEEEIYAYGNNYRGQLGAGNYNPKYDCYDDIYEPRQVTGFPKDGKILDVCCDKARTFFRVKLRSGEINIYACGSGFTSLSGSSRKCKPKKMKGFPDDSKILNIYCRSGHVFFRVKFKGGGMAMYVYGSNIYGQLGFDSKGECIYTPKEIKDFPKDSKILDVYCGDGCTFFKVIKDGEIKIYACGDNRCGQLGFDSKDKSIYKPRQVTGFPKDGKILDVCCGGKRTFFKVIKDGEIKIYACGDNRYSQLGFDSKGKYIYKPRQVTGFPKDSKILNVYCNFNYVLFLVKFKDAKQCLFFHGNFGFKKISGKIIDSKLEFAKKPLPCVVM